MGTRLHSTSFINTKEETNDDKYNARNESGHEPRRRNRPNFQTAASAVTSVNWKEEGF